MTAPTSRIALRATSAALLLGAGLGGFADGIVLHQIVQWHQMLSTRLPPLTMALMQANMRADGWFHAVMWGLVVAGIALLHEAARRNELPSARGWLAGTMLFGWGAFNAIEGVINHHLLILHRVHDLPRHEPIWDFVFLLIGGAGFMAAGAWLAHRATTRARAPR